MRLIDRDLASHLKYVQETREYGRALAQSVKGLALTNTNHEVLEGHLTTLSDQGVLVIAKQDVHPVYVGVGLRGRFWLHELEDTFFVAPSQSLDLSLEQSQSQFREFMDVIQLSVTRDSQQSPGLYYREGRLSEIQAGRVDVLDRVGVNRDGKVVDVFPDDNLSSQEGYPFRTKVMVLPSPNFVNAAARLSEKAWEGKFSGEERSRINRGIYGMGLIEKFNRPALPTRMQMAIMRIAQRIGRPPF